MPLNEDLLDAAIAGQVDLLAYGNSIDRELREIMREEDEALVALIILLLTRSGVAQEGNVFTAQQRRRVNEALAEINERTRESMRRVQAVVDRAVSDLIEAESEGESDALKAALIAALGAGVAFTPLAGQISVRLQPAHGKTTAEWATSLLNSRFAGIKSEIRRGLIEGRSITSIWRSVVNGPLRRSSRDIDAVTRTLLAHARSQVKEALYKINPFIKRVLWVSVLDSKTTPICRSLSGRIFRVGEGPRPPMHLRCRSEVVPFRGDPPDLPTYNDWIRRQSVAMQNRILGPTRAKAFRRDPSLTMGSFVNREGNLLTIDQLRGRKVV